MRILSFLGNMFAYFGIGIAVSMIFLSMFVMNLFENIDGMEESILNDAKTYLLDHKEDLKQYLLENSDQFAQQIPGIQEIGKEQLKQLCASPQAQISQQLCSQLDSMTDEQAKQALIKELLDTQLEKQLEGEAFKQQAEAFAGPLKEQITNVKSQVTQIIGEPLNYLAIGIILLVASTVIIFFSEGFNVKRASYKVSRNLLLNTLPFIAVFGAFALLTPDNVSDMLSKAVDQTELAKVPAFLITMLTTMALGIIKASTNPVLITAIIVSAASLAIAATMRILIKREAKTYKQDADKPKQ